VRGRFSIVCVCVWGVSFVCEYFYFMQKNLFPHFFWMSFVVYLRFGNYSPKIRRNTPPRNEAILYYSPILISPSRNTLLINQKYCCCKNNKISNLWGEKKEINLFRIYLYFLTTNEQGVKWSINYKLL